MKPIQRACHFLLATIVALLACREVAHAEPYLRVIAQRSPVHTGPGAEYRSIYFAERGEVFEVLERGTKGYWFRVRLEDGTTGWIFGDSVFPFEVGEPEKVGIFGRMWRGVKSAVLAPPAVVNASANLSFSAGILDTDGVFLLRPAWIIDPTFAVEAFLGLTPRSEKDIFVGGFGWTLRLIPDASFAPFVNASIGAAHIRPKADNFVDKEETLMALIAGGGFEITFKKQISLRLDARNWTLFDPDQASNGLELSGGLATFF